MFGNGPVTIIDIAKPKQGKSVLAMGNFEPENTCFLWVFFFI